MTHQKDVDSFLFETRLALAGASRSGKKFGNTILKEPSGRGYEIVPVHPEAEAIDGLSCVAGLADLQEDVKGRIAVVPPEQTLRLVEQASDAGLTKIWMQQGAESHEAIQLAQQRGITVVWIGISFPPHPGYHPHVTHQSPSRPLASAEARLQPSPQAPTMLRRAAPRPHPGTSPELGAHLNQRLTPPMKPRDHINVVAASGGGARPRSVPLRSRAFRILTTTAFSVMKAITFISEPQDGHTT